MNYDYQEVTPSPSTSDVADSSQSSDDGSEIGLQRRVPTLVGRKITSLDGVTLTVLLASDHMKLAFGNRGRDIVENIPWVQGWQDGVEPLFDYPDDETKARVQLQLLFGLLSGKSPSRLKATIAVLEEALRSESLIEGISQMSSFESKIVHQLQSPDGQEHQKITVFEIADDANDVQEALEEMFTAGDSQEEEMLNTSGFPTAFFEHLAPVMIIDLRAWADVVPVIYPGLYSNKLRAQWDRRRNHMNELEEQRAKVENRLDHVKHHQDYRVYDLLRLAADSLREKDSEAADDLDQAKKKVQETSRVLDEQLAFIDQQRDAIVNDFPYSGELYSGFGDDVWEGGLIPYRLVGVATAPVTYFVRRGASWLYCRGGVCSTCTESQVLASASRARLARLIYERPLDESPITEEELIAPSVKKFFKEDVEAIARMVAESEAASAEAEVESQASKTEDQKLGTEVKEQSQPSEVEAKSESNSERVLEAGHINR